MLLQAGASEKCIGISLCVGDSEDSRIGTSSAMLGKRPWPESPLASHEALDLQVATLCPGLWQFAQT